MSRKTRGLGKGETRRRKKRGKKAELRLVHHLQGLGWQAKRSAMSGIGRDMPDVYAACGSVLVAFEVKASRLEYAKIVRQQIEKLRGFLDFFSFYPNRMAVVAVTFPYRDWIFIRIPEGWNESWIKIDRETESTWNPELTIKAYNRA